ncbi:MAG: hypothetical protein A3E85_06015 [Gammaproteobacteria bacterium RIFCSPHIGHO2_12_FULL_45_12]|nr:MAG: hypothetical protein A3E85_06015 [Gammaproteobacteria bacterium RIFCSPHIGHO2_12_FULL_45_12]
MGPKIKKEYEYKNIESPFTEIFSLLKRYQVLSDGLTALVYNSDELIEMHQHIESVIETLLQGLQSLGQVVGEATNRKVIPINRIGSIGYLISSISNLTESLNTLKADASFELRRRGLKDF